MKRLFIGIPVKSENAARQAEKWRCDPLLNQNRFNWSKPENWHITLYFLGETPSNRISLLRTLVDESFRGVKAFQTGMIGTGVFPNLRNPKVFWLGLETLDPLMLSYQNLGESLRLNTFAFDPKPLKPHLTLARIKNLEFGAVFNSLFDEFETYNFGPVHIDQVVIFESILTSSGPVYKPLHQSFFK